MARRNGFTVPQWSGGACDWSKIDQFRVTAYGATYSSVYLIVDEFEAQGLIEGTGDGGGYFAGSIDYLRLFKGTLTVYGSVTETGSRGVSEEYPAAPEEVYGGSKRYVEILGGSYQSRGDFDFVSVRFASVIGPGSASASSPWRSDIFEKLRHTRAEIDVPFARDRALPLVHIDDAVDVAVRIVEAKEMAFSVYNSPSQTWTFGEMAAHVASVNPQIGFVFGQSKIVGHPHKTDASRFIREFGWRSLLLEDRIRLIVEETADSTDSTVLDFGTTVSTRCGREGIDAN